jgi:hypothetical protein
VVDRPAGYRGLSHQHRRQPRKKRWNWGYYLHGQTFSFFTLSDIKVQQFLFREKQWLNLADDAVCNLRVKREKKRKKEKKNEPGRNEIVHPKPNGAISAQRPTPERNLRSHDDM